MIVLRPACASTTVLSKINRAQVGQNDQQSADHRYLREGTLLSELAPKSNAAVLKRHWYLWAVFTMMLVLAIKPASAQPLHMLDDAIHAALDTFNENASSTFTYRELDRLIDAQRGGIIYLALHDRITGQRVPGIVDWMVAIPDGALWRAYVPGSAAYGAAYAQLPSALLADADDSHFRETADPALMPPTGLNDYFLPWEHGAWATVTRSYDVHGTGRIDFDLTGRLVTAAKDGVVIYANDSSTVNARSTGAWWLWNVVIIEHGPHEYSLYGHLAPGSLADALRRGCSADFSQPNCELPIRAGDPIGLEGNTGYSTAPHLHIEFGQRFGIVGYPGPNGTTHYTGYVYAEHNVGLSGYSAEQVGAWAYGRLLQAAHGPFPQSQVNLIRNGSFAEGTADWTPSGQLSWRVDDGVLRFLRLRTDAPPNWAAFFQNTGYSTEANSAFLLTFQLGNASAVPKTISASLLNRAGRDYESLTCSSQIAAGAPLTPHQMRVTIPDTWADLRVEFGVNPPDGLPAALITQIELRRIEAEALAEPLCAAGSEL